MHRGYIKVFRKLKDWCWYDDHNTKILFLHLLLSANHSVKNWHGIQVNPGQLITGRKELAAETGLTEQQIRTSMERLKSTSEITSETTNKYSIVTICNWRSYQGEGIQNNQQDNQQDNQQSTSNQPASNQQSTTTKECKNKKNAKKVKNKGGLEIHEDAVESIDWPVLISERLRGKLLSFFDNRKQAKKYMTPGSVAQNIEHVIDWMTKFSEDEICQAIESAICGNWQGLFEPKPRPSFTGTHVSTAKPQKAEIIGYIPPETPGPSKAETAAALEELQRQFGSGVKHEETTDDNT